VGFAGDIGYYYLTSHLPNRVLAIPLGLLAVALARFTPPWSLVYLPGLAPGTRSTVDWVPLAIALVSSMCGYFVHSNVRAGLGWLHYVIATPAFHHWHHDNIAERCRHTNYAPLFPWLDRLFGSHFLA
jgi:sterol desaturase/sphingolipid hydroxylase (fatty acid hydroxylase superfamily)